MLIPKLITHTNKIIGPKGPKVDRKASDVSVTPELSEVCHTPEINIITAVKVHMMRVSKIGPVIAISPCLTGFVVFAAPCIKASVPIPASLLKAPLLIPVKITPTKPPETAEFIEKSSLTINPIAGRNLSLIHI